MPRSHDRASDATTDAISRSLRLATDRTSDPWAVLQALRDRDGGLVDLRLLYANDAYWRLTGFDPTTSPGQPLSALVPGIDWHRGVAATLFRTVESGRDLVDPRHPTIVQSGPMAGTERVFELEFTVTDDVVSAGFRDITDAVRTAEQQDLEARRTAAVAEFLAAAVDPAIARTDIFDRLARQLAGTLGDLCVILEQDALGEVVLAAIDGGPGGRPVAVDRAAIGQRVPIENDALRSAIRTGESLFLTSVPPDVRDQFASSMRLIGMDAALAQEVTGLIAVPILSAGAIVGRLHCVRFQDTPDYTPDDLATVTTLAAATALVFERRAVEDRLERSLRRFEALFEQAPIPMIVTSDQSVRFNGAACALFGRDEEELIRLSGQPDSPWIPEDQREEWVALRQSFASHQAIRGLRTTIIRSDGERRLIEASAIPLADQDQRTTGLVVIIIDLTERESLEAQLRHAQKMEALGRLAGGIAHDFNNVLMGILGYAEFLASDVRAGTASADDADQVLAATRRAIELTARLTTFARREAARRSPTRLDALISDVLPLLRRLAPESIQLVTELSVVPPVLLDALEFEQVIVNLVVNAVDAMPTGGRLTIETHLVADDGASVAATHAGSPRDTVMVAVSDTGTGMDEATRSRIFEPFYTTKGVGEGTGLGLSMVFGAVERANGTIHVYSEPGLGTTFKLYLPPTGDGAMDESSSTPDAAAAGGDETVLLIEDDELVRDLVTRGLRSHGYGVLVAARPSEALAIAAGAPFDVVVTDVVMPEMTGDAVGRALREQRPDLPIVFMSGYTARSLEFELGPGDTLVHKPVTPVALARAVRAALDRSHAGTSS